MDELKMIGNDGLPLFGYQKGAVTDYNTIDFEGKRGESRLTKYFRNRFRMKHWQYVGICGRNAIVGAAVIQLGYLCNVFVYLFNPRDNSVFERHFLHPLSSGVRFSGSCMKGEIKYRSGVNRVTMLNEASQVVLEAEIEKRFFVHAVMDRITEPLDLITKAGTRGFSYTRKEAGMSVEGKIALDENEFILEKGHPGGIVDYTVAYPERNTFWNWASGGGKDRDGNSIAFNFSSGFYDEELSENVFWVNGRRVKTGKVHFEYDTKKILSPWKITSDDGKAELSFQPLGERSSRVNALVIKSFFQQPFGVFSGRFKEGRNIFQFRDITGFTEEHGSKW